MREAGSDGGGERSSLSGGKLSSSRMENLLDNLRAKGVGELYGVFPTCVLFWIVFHDSFRRDPGAGVKLTSALGFAPSRDQ